MTLERQSFTISDFKGTHTPFLRVNVQVTKFRDTVTCSKLNAYSPLFSFA